MGDASVIVLVEGDAPATPASGLIEFYSKTDHGFYTKDSTGTERNIQSPLTETAGTAGFTIVGGTVTPKTLTVSDTLTLALGAANLKRFMNAAGTGMEWASGLNVKTYTRDLTAGDGDVSYTSVGYKPSAIIFLGSPGSGSGSVGFDNGTTHIVLVMYQDGTIIDTSHSLYGGNAAATAYQFGVVKTLDADGFTITFTKTGSPTGTLVFGCVPLR